MPLIEYSDVRYLSAKRTVDDRALNRVVLADFRESLREFGDRPLEVLELGAGVGTMLSRLYDWEILGDADYTLLDRDSDSLQAAQEHLVSWSKAESLESGLTFRHSRGICRVRTILADAFAFMDQADNRRRYDVVLANAVLDLMDLVPALTSIWRVLRPGGRFWFSINFDGETIFEPEDPLDALVMQLYHRTMDERVRDGRPAGDSRTGRHLLTRIGATGARLSSAGSSDWVVVPDGAGYPHDEAYFLHHIVNTIDVALKGHPALEAAAFEAWVAGRHAQVERAELYYIAHQLDVLGIVPGNGG
jgi:SAM-dependent methyltransferase